jgi:uncharacterized sulfatase
VPLTSRAAQQPNILLVMMDDLGYPTSGSYGNKLVPTPNLDRLAQEGVRFTQAYATPQCTPTRATLVTGQYTARNKMWHVIPGYGCPYGRVTEPPYAVNLSRDAFTLAKGLKAAGYATGIVGKWHLTTNDDGNYSGLKPEAAPHYGFDYAAKTIPNEQATGDKGVDRLTSEAIAFMDRNRQRPWFCYLSQHSIHGPVSAPEALIRKYRETGYPETGLNNATYLAALEHIDASIGRLMGALDKQGQRDRTVFVYTSDNGGVLRVFNPEPQPGPEGRLRLTVRERQFSNAPLRCGKGTHYEGGVRVPMIVRWPGSAKAGSTQETPVHIVDLMPTFFSIAGASTPKGYITDGVDFTPLLKGARIAFRSLYWYAPFYDVRWPNTPSAAVRDGDYKLIHFFGDYIDDETGEYFTTGRDELFDLRHDPGERNNLAAKLPEKVTALKKKLYAWIESSGATIPALNTNYDPARPLIEVRGGKG